MNYGFYGEQDWRPKENNVLKLAWYWDGILDLGSSHINNVKRSSSNPPTPFEQWLFPGLYLLMKRNEWGKAKVCTVSVLTPAMGALAVQPCAVATRLSESGRGTVPGFKRPLGFWNGEKYFRWILLFHHTQGSLGHRKAFPCISSHCLKVMLLCCWQFCSFFVCWFVCLSSLKQCTLLKCQESPVPHIYFISTSHASLGFQWHYSVLKTWTHVPDLPSRFLLLKVALGLWFIPLAPTPSCSVFWFISGLHHAMA